MDTWKKVSVILQHFEGCPNGPKMIGNTLSAIAYIKDQIDYKEILIDTPELAEEYKFRGSPTLLINGEDFENMPEPVNPSLSCRFYSKGIPSPEQIKIKILGLLSHP